MFSRISNIGSLLKKIYRIYISELHSGLQHKGFTDLRPSFLEVLISLCEQNGSSIKEIGKNCGLKKQTMTSHLNELECRGYITRRTSEKDKREQNIYLTEYGEKFKLRLYETIQELEKKYGRVIGDVELERLEHVLSNFFEKVRDKNELSVESRIQGIFNNLNLEHFVDSNLPTQ